MEYTHQIKQQLIQYLSQFITHHKLKILQAKLNKRTKFLTVVLEDIYKPHNASAVLRTCECLGLQEVHVVEQKNKFKPKKEVVMGADKWMSLYHYNLHNQQNILTCINNLKTCGYKIVATTLQKNNTPISDINLNEKLALCFGTEESGLSEELCNEADILAHIPMQGFTQSFNISVSVSIILYELTRRLYCQPQELWQLTEDEKDDLQIQWMSKIINNGKILIDNFLKENQITM